MKLGPGGLNGDRPALVSISNLYVFVSPVKGN